MAKAKTGSFYLTETIELQAADVAGTRVQGQISLAPYVSVVDGIAIAVESVDFIYQWGSAYNGAGSGMLAASGSVEAQLVDLNPSTALVRADDHSLIASGCLNIDVANNITTKSTDHFPDNFGPSALSESFLCVNDTLFLVGGNSIAAVGGSSLFISVRAKCRAVKLAKEDWIAVAIQATSSQQ